MTTSGVPIHGATTVQHDQTTAPSVSTRSVLRVADLSVEEVHRLLEPNEDCVRLDGGSYLLDIPAWRTHLQTAADEAVTHAGGVVVASEWPLLWTDRHSPLGADVDPPLRAALLGTEDHALLTKARRSARVPIVNATSDLHQPVHVLADLLTLRELLGQLRGRRIAFVGGPDAYRDSLVEAAVRCGVDLVLAGATPDERLGRVLEENRALAHLFGGSIHLVDPTRGVLEVDAVIGDPVPFALLATTTHLPLHLTGAAADDGASLHEGPRQLLFHRQENLQCIIRRLLHLVSGGPSSGS
ncbi:MAG: hypothetical protein R2715_10645 [Ilumatobacteraceae bacterium]